MHVEIYCGDTLIGWGDLHSDDPPMGGASGAFEPSEAYQARAHAGELEGSENPSAWKVGLIAKSKEHGPIKSEMVFIQDYDQSLGERRICLGGIPYPQYEKWFGEDPAYKAYRSAS